MHTRIADQSIFSQNESTNISSNIIRSVLTLDFILFIFTFRFLLSIFFSLSFANKICIWLAAQLQDNLIWISLSDTFDVGFYFSECFSCHFSSFLSLFIFLFLFSIPPLFLSCSSPFNIFWCKCQYISPKHIYMHVSYAPIRRCSPSLSIPVNTS